MSEEKLPFVILNLDKPRTFRWSINAIILFQQKTGAKLSELFNLIAKSNENVETIRLVAWCGLKAADKDFGFTIEEVGDLIGMAGLTDVMLNIYEHVHLATGASEKKTRDVLMELAKRAEEGTGIGEMSSPPPAKSESAQSTSGT
jgi:hypothetical protein